MTNEDKRLIWEAAQKVNESLFDAADANEERHGLGHGRAPIDMENLARENELNDAEGRPIEIGDIVKLGMSDRKYVVVEFGGGAVEIAELGPAQGHDAVELKVVGELGG
tara:strand:- start:465 stop:791 length:327 start_codon:yes stop_codon:yes gene_type:complete